jgi:hypothetical protein
MLFLPYVSFLDADKATMFNVQPSATVGLEQHLSYSPALPSHHTSPLWAQCFLRYSGWLGPVPRGSKSRHMTLGHVLSCPMRVECLQDPPAMARLPGQILAQAAFLPVAGTLGHAAVYITLPPPIQTFLPSFLNQLQAARIDNPAISTTTTHDSIG